ncbi:RING finger domain-containing protein [Spironucleus salmonicida]|uniref:RING finger domain-containing protein n=1 Tax=Spironucleus salmonicida TaxID=348837 RepID=V6LMV2_9EUKA|nr:RING finger domain-containing protein [Spironucleus salmonicida]|eukprot:EST45548.1 RING finger domain-containing protein [Spironucleus salmonicida]
MYGLQFGKYCCLDCRLICDLGDENKPIFHSKDQNQCAIGIQAQSIYCDKCNWCYHMNYFADHQCRKSYGNCCCCLEDLDNSNKPKIALKCSHCIHLHCQQMILEGNDIKCPVCRKSMLCEEQIDDYKYQFQKLQDMYFFYSNQAVYGCYDCDERFEIFEHPVGVFCMYCQTPNCYLVERLHESFVDLKILTVEICRGRMLFYFHKLEFKNQIQVYFDYILVIFSANIYLKIIVDGQIIIHREEILLITHMQLKISKKILLLYKYYFYLQRQFLIQSLLIIAQILNDQHDFIFYYVSILQYLKFSSNTQLIYIFKKILYFQCQLFFVCQPYNFINTNKKQIISILYKAE